MKRPEKPVEELSVTVHGDPAVGIPNSYFTVGCWIDPMTFNSDEDFTDCIEDFRTTIEAAYKSLFDWPIELKYDFELAG